MTKEEILKERYTLKDIYGERSYHKYVEVGEKYKYLFSSTSEEALLTGKCYLEITITHIRSGVAFYTIEGYPEKEFHFDLKSALCAFCEHKIQMWNLLINLLKKKKNLKIF
jgi:hypothetical protein